MSVFFIFLLAASLAIQVAATRVEKCSEGQWLCRDGRCVEASAKCNGALDCADGSDETFPLCRNTECKEGFFKCTYGACVKSTATCDDVQDCADNSDELLLSCRNETDYYGCLTQEMKRRTHSIRRGMISTLSQDGLYRNITELCVMKERKCKNGQVVGFPNRCNGKMDCNDGSDESVEACASNWCTMSTTRSGVFFKCAYGACIPKHAFCNGVMDCADGSDENIELCNANEEVSGACILPHFPKHGFYIVIGHPSFYPGQAFNVIHLNFSCHPGYRLVGPISSSCVNGWWSENRLPQCVDCGRIRLGAKLLIIGGRRAERNELPWHAGIYTKTTKPYKQICGGSLVGKTLVISAAHCFWHDAKKKLPASNYAVAVGKLYRPWNSTKDIDAQKSDVREIQIPPRYQGSTMNYQDDIALIMITTPFEYRAHVRPVCLDFDHKFSEKQLNKGNFGKVAGWGLTSENGRESQVLNVVELPYIHVEECIISSSLDYKRYITGDKICAGYKNGTALCKGDSGGGLTFPDHENGIVRYFLRGIVSTAPNNNNLCNAYTMTSFTDVIKHESFIKDHPETPVPIQLATKKLELCSNDKWRCRDGKCIAKDAKCNGAIDCADGSDETFPLCRNTKCAINLFQCTYGACVNSSATCDGVMDCADNSDELVPRCRNETGYLGCLSKVIEDNVCLLDSYPAHECEMKDRLCKDKQDVGLFKRCDGKVDCKDGSDESLETCASNWCPVSNAFKCAYGGCVPGVAMCDGIIDCADASDETEELCKADKIFSGECILPPFPTDGSYTVVGQSNIYPGKAFDVIYLSFSCNPGYRLVGPASPYCLNGWWSDIRMPQCVSVCKLKKNHSVEYHCLISHTKSGSMECDEYVPSGTVVRPQCRRPDYFYPVQLPDMHCVDGIWDYVAIYSPECGRISPGVKQRVEIGHHVAERGEIPWMAILYSKEYVPFSYMCSGTLISSAFVITAAHCLWDISLRGVNGSIYAVAVGKLHQPWNSSQDIDTQTSDVMETIISPRYQHEDAKFQEDVLLVRVATPFVFNVYVRPVCLDFDLDFEKIQLRQGNIGRSAGWYPYGKDSSTSLKLKIVDHPYLSIEECVSKSSPIFKRFITSDKICIEYTNGTELCIGDSGNGLAFPATDRGTGRYYLRGIMSVAIITGHRCSSDIIVGFTQISKHASWIKSIIEPPTTVPSLNKN